MGALFLVTVVLWIVETKTLDAKTGDTPGTRSNLGKTVLFILIR